MSNKPNILQRSINRIFNIIKSLFINGLLTILPLALTAALFMFTFRLLKSWLQPLYHVLPADLREIPHSEIVLAIVAICMIGFVVKVFVLHPLIEWIESLFGHIPLVRQVYFGIKQLVYAFHPREEEAFEDVALVEFPRTGIYSLGFITGTTPTGIIPGETKRMFNVFIPNTPNPTTGYYIIVKEEDCFRVNLTRQEAMTIIISGGIITPDRFLQKQQ